PANWGNELPLTDRSFDLEEALFLGEGDPVPGLFLGDYEGLKAVGNDFVATFCQAGVSRNDPKSIFFRRIIAGSPLEAGSVSQDADAPTLMSPHVAALSPEAIHRWQVTGVNPSALNGLDVRIADLTSTTRSLTSGHTLRLDAGAAGRGWFVGPMPG